MFSVEEHLQVLHLLHDVELGQPPVPGLPSQDGRQTVHPVPGEVLTGGRPRARPRPGWPSDPPYHQSPGHRRRSARCWRRWRSDPAPLATIREVLSSLDKQSLHTVIHRHSPQLQLTKLPHLSYWGGLRLTEDPKCGYMVYNLIFPPYKHVNIVITVWLDNTFNVF